MFKPYCSRQVQMFHPEFPDGIHPLVNVDYRLFHQSLLEMNERIKRDTARTTTHGWVLAAFRHQSNIAPVAQAA
jgi:hypothetical protein